VYHGHGGSVPGYRSQIQFDALLRLGLIVLIDGVGPADEIANPLLDTAVSHAQAAEAARPSEPPVPTPEAYRPYLGMYRMARLADVSQIEYRGGKLIMTGAPHSPFPGAPPAVLEPTDDPRLFMVRGGRYAGEPLTFSVSEDGHVTGFRAAGFLFNRLAEHAGLA
jgi:hypothetical protein